VSVARIGIAIRRQVDLQRDNAIHIKAAIDVEQLRKAM
jgi:hypothetical protein